MALDFSRISTRLATLSALGVTFMLITAAAGWYMGLKVDAAVREGRIQQDISRDLVDTKSSMRGMQIATRDLRLAASERERSESLGNLEARYTFAMQHLDNAITGMTVKMNVDRAQGIRDLLTTYREDVKLLSEALRLDDANTVASIVGKLNTTAERVTGVVDEAVDAAKVRAGEAIEERRDVQFFSSVLNNAMSVSMIALLIASGIFGKRAVANPITRITASMNSLVVGKLDVAIPFTDRGGEIGEMATAVEVFRQNAIKVRDLNAQEAALQAESADLQLNIATVVSRAVDGDFGARINKNYSNADLARFAASVDQLVASVEQGVTETGRVVSSLAEGDLTQTMRGEFRGAFKKLQTDVNSTMDGLRSVMGEVRSAIDMINSGAGELRIASDDLSKRTEQQAASLEETAAALEEITSAVKNSTDRSVEASAMMTEARQSTEHSSAVVKDAVAAMERIEQASHEISQIINVIDEIAFQTNLLALNAGVEAARAGEAGKGFAVVAQEVRELAQRSAAAAKDIKGLITRSSDEVKGGVELVTKTGTALVLIEGHVVKINDHMNSIATAAREQSTGLTEINVAVNQMDQTTQQNAAMVEESTAATSKLAEEAENLNKLIARFQVDARTAAPRLVKYNDVAKESPVRNLERKLRRNFGGNATAVAADWQEF
jgi:methyl-accepting chemotaxis protein